MYSHGNYADDATRRVEIHSSNNDRFCKIMKSVALLTPKFIEICDCKTSNSKQTKPARLLCIAEMVFLEQRWEYIERRRMYLNIYRGHFIFVVQKLSSKCSDDTLKNTRTESPPNRFLYDTHKMPAVCV